MKFSCPNCGQSLEAENQYSGFEIDCPSCQLQILIPTLGHNPGPSQSLISRTGSASDVPDTSTHRHFLGRMANRISDAGGLEKLEGFSPAQFFAEVFRRHSVEELEEHFAVGTKDTTPSLSDVRPGWPTPWAFFKIATVSLILSIGFYWAIFHFQNTKLIPGWIFVGCFGIPCSLIVFFIETNILRNISLYRIANLLLIGGLLSLVISLFLTSSSGFGSWIGPMSAGLFEETGKLAAVILFTRKWDGYPWILNGIVFGAAIGTGFSAFETAGYVFDSLSSRENFGAEFTMTLRAFLSPFTHTIWTAAAAGALWRVRGGRDLTLGMLSSWGFLRVFLIVIALHVLWNSPITIPVIGGFSGFMIFRLILGLIGWIIILSLIQSGLREVALQKNARNAPVL